MKIPLRQDILYKEKETVKYDFPDSAKIHVSVGQAVVPETVLADYDVSWGFRIFHVGDSIHAKGSAFKKAIKKQVGDKVFTGEIIAKQSTFFSLKHQVFKAPIDGIIESIDDNGDVMIRMFPQHMTQSSLYWGVVKAINKNTTKHAAVTEDTALAKGQVTVVIETQVAVLYGVMGSGKKRQGRITLACEASDFLLPQKMDERLENSIIVGGSLVDHGVLEKAIMLHASGIITGGIHLRDAAAMGMKVPQETQATDVGTSIIVTEGFGTVSIGLEHFAMLSTYNGRYAIIDGNAASLTIPIQQQELVAAAKLQAQTVKAAATVEASPGLLVRILEANTFGKTGKIKKISTRQELLGSGINAYTATVVLNAEKSQATEAAAVEKKSTTMQELTVPLQNLEAIS